MNSLLEKSEIQTLIPKFIDYLKDKDWFLVKENDVLSVWGAPDHTISIRLPNPNSQAEDSVELTIKALQKLATYFQSSVEYVFNAMTEYSPLAKQGKISFRIISEDVKSGKIAFKDGIDLFASTKLFIENFAQSAWKKRAVFKSKKPSSVLDFMSNVKLGQTEQGSYIVNVYYPIEQPNNSTDLAQATFSESVDQNIASGLAALSSYLDDATDAPKDVGDFIQKGISANLCDTLIRFSGKQQHRDLEITLHSTEASEPNQVFVLPKSKIAKIKAISKRLHQEEYSFKKFDVIGKITDRHSLSGNIEEGGRITVKMEIYGKMRTINTDLSPEAYKLANKATNDGKLVKLTGSLHLKKEKGELSNLIDILILENKELPL
ncbi:hypothetical protein Q7404_10465 [Glaesserella parasuis]|nr:hypothetical protein [Glaesserella parasuis]